MNLIEALEAAEIDYRPGKADDEIWLCCPFCTDQRFRLGVNIVNGSAHCFNDGCEFKSRGQYTFDKLQAALDTGEIQGKQLKRKKKRRMDKVELPEGFHHLKQPAFGQDHWNMKAWGFLRNRGVPKDQIIEKKIGYTVIGPLAYRIIIPVYLQGKLVGLVGRDFTGKQEPKYKNSIGAKCLYNLPDKQHSSICLSEGAFDALAIERGARKLKIDSCAVLGHSLKDEQVELLKDYKRVYIWFDPDDAGMDGAIKIRKQLKDKSVRIVLPKGLLEEGKFDARDPSDLDVEEISKRLERASSFTEEVAGKLAAWRAYYE